MHSPSARRSGANPGRRQLRSHAYGGVTETTGHARQPSLMDAAQRYALSACGRSPVKPELSLSSHPDVSPEPVHPWPRSYDIGAVHKLRRCETSTRVVDIENNDNLSNLFP